MTTSNFYKHLELEESRQLIHVLLTFEDEVRDAWSKKECPLGDGRIDLEIDVDSFFQELKYFQSEDKNYFLYMNDVAGLVLHKWAVEKLNSKGFITIPHMSIAIHSDPEYEPNKLDENIIAGLRLINNNMGLFGPWHAITSTNNFGRK
ncbi:hypothetical protein N8500_09880 [Candidatus Puniceispirillum sp.]|nr:hypothetical protein [Candidatus Puniceispirillum sp.]